MSEQPSSGTEVARSEATTNVQTPREVATTSANHGTREGHGRRRNTHYIESEDKGFEGKTKEIGAVLGLKNERMTHKVSFDTFREKLADYVLKEFTQARHVIVLVEEMKDPMKDFVDNNKPKIKRKRSNKDKDETTKKIKTEKLGSAIESESEDMEDDYDDNTIYYDPDDFVEKMLLETKIKSYVAQEEQLKNNINKVYAIIWGQCSSSLQAVIKGDDNFDIRHRRRDVVWLLTQIKTVSAGIDNKSNRYKNLYGALLQLLTMRQGENESNDKYLTRFKSNIQTTELAGGKDFLSPTTWLGVYHSQQEKNDEREKFLAMMFLSRSDQRRYDSVADRLQQQMNLGIDQYPTTIATTFDLLVRESGTFKPQQYNRNGGTYKRQAFNKFMFLQVKQGCKIVKDNDELVASVNGTFHKSITCYNCQNKGHYSNECPYVEAKRGGVNLLMRAVALTQNDPSVCDINPNWILLDTCSTASVAGNSNLVTDIKHCENENELYVATNGGGMVYTSEAKLKLFPLVVHYNPNSIATILSIKDVASLPGCYMTMDTRQAREIVVSFEDGKPSYTFKECADGLYYYDTSNDTSSSNSINAKVTPYMFLQTVEKNKIHYSKKDIAKADEARALQQRLGFPGTATLVSYLSQNMLSHTSVTTDDVHRGNLIYGPLPQLLKGKMTDSNRPYTVSPTISPVHPTILAQCSELALFADYFFVNGLTFLLTNTEKLGFLSATFCQRTGGMELVHGLEKVIDLHAGRGFSITTVHGDNDFTTKKLKDGLPGISFHSCAADQHVSEAERPIRSIKERTRCITHDVPFTIFTRLMTKELIFFIVEQINYFPSKGTLSTTESPNLHVLGYPRPDMSLPFVTFGSYCLVYMGTTNTQKARAVPAIALRPSNLSGGFYFMSLYSGKRLHSYKWEELPIDADIIDRVHELGLQENQPPSINSELLFEWSIGVPIDDAQGAPFPQPEDINFEQPYASTNESTNEHETDNENDNNDKHNEPNDNESNDDNELHHDNEYETEYVNDNADDMMKDNDDVAHQASDMNEANMFLADDENPVVLSSNVVSDIASSAVTQGAAPMQTEPTQIDSCKVRGVAPRAPKTKESLEQVQNSTEVNEDTVAEDRVPELRRSSRLNKGTKTVLEVSHDAKKRYETRIHKYFLQRTRKKRRPRVHLQFLMKQRKKADDHEKSLMDIALSVIFAQRKIVRDKNGVEVINNKEMPASKGFKVFGEEAVAAMIKEFRQLHNGAAAGKPVVAPIRYEDITPEEFEQVMEAVNLIKKKRNGTIKGRSCLNGSKQKKFLKEGESIASPTVCLEAILMTLGIDIYEERDVAIFDVPGAYLHALMPEDKNVIMVLRGKFVDIMCQVDPSYHEYVTVNSKGQKVLYLKILRALYGCIESALLWYQLYAETLEGLGFKINPYDRCVANKVINGSQCTICWYVDDNKISHADKDVVSEVLKQVEEHFGKLVISRGNTHDLLGMKIELDRKNKKVKIDTSVHIREAITMFEQCGEEVEGTVANPGNSQFFKVKNECKPLVGLKADVFHSTVAKLLFTGKRGRPDLEPYIAFLCTRVSKSTESDWKKLLRVLRFAKQTIGDKRTIGASSLSDLYTWIDAAYAVHPDMKSQTGGLMSLGHGAIHCKSSKQKLNTKSSTESELVGMSDYLPYNLWARMFLSEQGYELNTNTIFQDNQSAIRMETNGRTSCTGNSRHIDIRYFFVADKVKQKEVKIQYCPTELMIADYFTKPLQGRLFHTLRDIIMGETSIFEMMEQYFPIKEHIGNND